MNSAVTLKQWMNRLFKVQRDELALQSDKQSETFLKDNKKTVHTTAVIPSSFLPLQKHTHNSWELVTSYPMNIIIRFLDSN